MITKFKIFEKYSDSRYKVGDYVIIKPMSENKLIMRGFPADELEHDYSNKKLVVELIPTPSIWKDNVNKTLKMKFMDFLDKKSKPFTGQLPDEPAIIRLYNEDILRKLTPEEIEDYKLKKEANKYNL